MRCRLTLLAAFTSLSLCSGYVTARAEGLTILTGTAEAEAPALFWKDACKEFTAKTGIKVNYTSVPSHDHLKPKLIQLVAQKQAPEIVVFPSDFAGVYKSIELSKVPQDFGDEHIQKNLLGTVTVDGTLYGAPWTNGNHIMMYYNKKFVTKPAETFEELIAQKTEVEKKGVKLIGWNYNEPYWFMAFLGAHGGWPLDSNDQFSLDTAGMREFLGYYYTLGDLLPRECDYNCSYKRFIDKEYAYALNGVWAYKDMETALGADFGVAVVPSIKGKTATPMFSTMAMAFPGKSLEGPQAANIKKFVRFMQSEAMQKKLQKIDMIPVHDKVFGEFVSSANQNRKAMLKQLSNARSMPSHPNMALAWEAIRKGWLRYVGERKKGKDAAVAAETSAKFMQDFALSSAKNAP